MSRGGSKNGNNSPLIGENGVLATTSELNALTRNMRDNFIADISKPPVNLHSEEEVKQAIINYFDDCERAGKRPGNMGLYRALNLTRQDINNIFNGKLKNKLTPACMDILKKALQLLSEYREQLGSQGKLNPVTMIFWQKNYDGLEDSTRLDIAPIKEKENVLTPDQIRAAIDTRENNVIDHTPAGLLSDNIPDNTP